MEVKKKLLDIVKDTVRFKHYSLSTERTYVYWIKAKGYTPVIEYPLL